YAEVTDASDSFSQVLERIEDFNRAEGDIIDLGAIDADGDPTNGDTAFIISAHGFTGVEGELMFESTRTGIKVFADVDGDRKADFAFIVAGEPSLTAADFVL